MYKKLKIYQHSTYEPLFNACKHYYVGPQKIFKHAAFGVVHGLQGRLMVGDNL